MRKFSIFSLCCASLSIDLSNTAMSDSLQAPEIIELKRRIEIPIMKNDTLQSHLFALETARDQLYGELEKECETLKETYKIGCRLKGAVIDGQIFVNLSGTQKVELASTSLYELTRSGAPR